MRLIIATVLAAALTASAVVTAQSKSACNRACLVGFADTYLKALAGNAPNAVPLAANAKVTINGRLVRLADAFWDAADRIAYRFDIVNDRLGDVATEAVVQNSDGSKTMYMVRLKVADGKITEVETVKANKGEADRLWDPDNLKEVSPSLQLSMRAADQDSYYGLIAAAESYWRAFQTNGTEDYRPAALLPDTRRFENGVQTTGMVRNGAFVSAADGFDKGRFVGRNLWDRRYPVVDTERGIVLSIVRFGLKDGMKSQSTATTQRSPGRGVLRREVRDDPGDSRCALQLAGCATDRLGAVVRPRPRRLVERSEVGHVLSDVPSRVREAEASVRTSAV